MFSNFAVGMLMGLGVAGWVYAKAQHRNGGLTKQSLLVAGIVGAIVVLVATTAMAMIFK